MSRRYRALQVNQVTGTDACALAKSADRHPQAAVTALDLA
jgi:hypothetical protein